MKKRKQLQNIWIFACICGVGCLLTTVLLSLPAAKLMQNGTVPIKAETMISYVILALSALAGSVVTAKIGNKKVLLLCLVCASVFFLSLAIMNGVLQHGQFQRIGETGMIIYAVCILTGLICAGRKKKY